MRLPALSAPVSSRRAGVAALPVAPSASPDLVADATATSSSRHAIPPRVFSRRTRASLAARRALRQGRATLHGVVAQTIEQTMGRVRVLSRPRAQAASLPHIADAATAAASTIAVAPIGAALAITANAVALDTPTQDRAPAAKSVATGGKPGDTAAAKAQLKRRVWSLAAPAIGEQLLTLGVGVSDTFLSGHLSVYASAHLGYGPATAVAAVGAAGMITWMVLTAFFSINVGVTALVARATGANDAALARRAAGQGALLGVTAGVVMLALAAPLADVVTLALGVDGQVATLAADFIRVWAIGLPATGVASACTAAMRGAGDTRRPMLVMLVVNGVNIVASWLLLNGSPALGLPAIGVVGSACGAALGWTLGCALALTLLWRRHPVAPRLNLAAFRPQWEVAQRVLRVGLPSAAELIIFQLGVLGFNRQVVSLGPTSYAANVTINTVESLGTLPAVGFGVAATALVGQALGARHPELAAQATMAALRPCVALMVALGALAALAPQLLLGLFVADPSVLTAGDLAMRISLLTLPTSGATFVLNGALRGAGDTKFPVIMRTVGPWGLRLPLAALLIPLFGLPGGRIAMALDYFAQTALGAWRFRSGRWRKTVV
ncbi:MAG TPA: MATE family efflux transporter [Ktedonobacterales bacterium]|nr:MATE family efflux transporter [Ktedonobacterales bacterium]